MVVDFEVRDKLLRRLKVLGPQKVKNRNELRFRLEMEWISQRRFNRALGSLISKRQVAYSKHEQPGIAARAECEYFSRED